MYTKIKSVGTNTPNKVGPGRKPGTPNGKGDLKINTIKFRVSDKWLDVLEKVKQECPVWYRGKTESEIFRWLILEGALKYCGANAFEDNNELKELLQTEISKI